jgi:hypothetical protein
VVEKIWNFEVSGHFVDFSEAKDPSGIIFQFPEAFCEIIDCRLIVQKHKGLSAKSPGI